MAGSQSIVRTTVSRGVALVELDDTSGIPRLSRSLLAALRRQFTELQWMENVRAIVLAGTDKCFAAGADLSEVNALTPAEARQFSRLGQSLMEQIERFPRPVVAAVRGYCLGGGFDLAMACHLHVAADDAVLGNPGGSLGLLTGWGGTSRLPRLVGRARALELLVTGRQIRAEESRRWGLVNRVAPAGSVLQAADELARATGQM